MDIYSALIPTATDTDREAIAAILAELPAGTLSTLAAADCTIRPLAKSERYDKASPALKRLGIDVDSWPSPPAGLFVIEERTVYVRSRSRMTVVHETMHALDCALGSGVYLSSTSAELREIWSITTGFVTPYAGSGTDEWFAECARAFAGDFNDVSSHWPRATRERLLALNPDMHAYLERLFAKLAPAGEQMTFGFTA